MLQFTIDLQKGTKIVMQPASLKSPSVTVSVYDKDGKVISFGYFNRQELINFAKAL